MNKNSVETIYNTLHNIQSNYMWSHGIVKLTKDTIRRIRNISLC